MLAVRRLLPAPSAALLALLAPAAAQAHSVTVISTPAVLEPNSGSPGDKDNCPPANSNADPEEGTHEVHVVASSAIPDPGLRITDNNSPTGAWSTDTRDDLYLDEFSALNGVTNSGGTRNLDYLDGVLDGQLAAGTYAVYFNIEKVGYNQDTLTGCAGLSVTNDHEGFTYELLSNGVLQATAAQVVAMEKSTSVDQNDLRWLDTKPPEIEAEVGESFCFRTKYRWQSQNSAEQLVAQIYHKADVVRLDSFDFYYYNTNGADPGSIDSGVPGVTAPGTTPSVSFFDQAYLQKTDLPGTQSSGDHYVGEYCFTVVGPGSSRFIPYFQSQVNRDRGTWKVDTGYPGFLSEPPSVINPPVLEVTKDCDVSATELIAGETRALTHTIEACNTGLGDAADVVLVDQLPSDPRVTYVSSSGGTYDAGMDSVTWDIGTLAAGACITETVTLNVSPAATDSGSIDTNVAASITGVSAVKAEFVSSDTYAEPCNYPIVRLVPGATLDKQALGFEDMDMDGLLSPGDVVHYSLTYANTGDLPLSGATLVDDLDEVYVDTVLAVSGGGFYDGDSITWSLGTIAVGGSGTVTYDVLLGGPGVFPAGTTPVANVAVLSSPDLGGSLTDTATVSVVASAALSLSKAVTGTVDVDGDGLLSPGDQVTYRLDYASTGNADATAVVLEDDPEETFVASVGAISGGGSYDGDLISWPLGTLGAGTSGFVTYTATLRGPGAFAAGATAVTNVAVLDSAEADPVSETATVTVDAAPELQVAKTALGFDDLDADGVLSPGDAVHYQVSYANSGNASATGVVLSDDPDETFVAAVTDVSAGGAYDGDLVVWNLGTLAPAASGDVFYTAVLAGPGAFPSGATAVVNVAVLDSAETGPVDDSVTVTVNAEVALAVSKSTTGYTDADGDGVLSPGDTVHFRIDYANDGNADAADAAIADDPDEAFISAISAISGGGSYDGDTITWSLGTLGAGESGFVTYDATLAGPGTFTAGTTPVHNTAVLSAPGYDAVQDDETVTVTAAAGLTVDKSVASTTDVDGDGVLSPGDQVTYQVAYASTGNAPATGVTVTDDPDEATVAAISGISGGGSYDGDLISWSLGTLQPGDSGTLTYTATLAGPGTFADGDTPVPNTVVIDSDETPPDEDGETVTVTAFAALTIAKAATGYTDADGNGVLSPGDAVHYQVDYASTGNAPANGVTVTDDPNEAFVASISAISGGGSYDGNVITWSLGTLQPGASGSLTYTATLKGAGTFLAGSTPVSNVAVIDSNETEPDSDGETVTVTAYADLSVTKASTGYDDLDGSSAVSPGDAVHYRIDYASTGNAPATGVTVVDNPDETYVAGISAITGGGSYDGDLVTWSLGLLMPGASGSLTYTATLKGPGAFPAGTTGVGNTAVIDSTETPPEQDDEEVPVTGTPSLVVDKAVLGYDDIDLDGVLSPLDIVHYALTYANVGDAPATAVTLVDDVDEAHIDSVDASASGGVYDGFVITWDLGTLDPGESGTLEYDVKLVDSGTFAAGVTTVPNTATLDSADTAPVSDSASVDVNAGVGLSVDKQVTGTVDVDGNGVLSPGDRVEYRVDFANDGNAIAHDVQLTDTPDAHVANVISISDGGVWNGSNVVWSLGDLGVGEAGFVTYTAVLAGPGAFEPGETAVTNNVLLESAESTPIGDSATVTVTAFIALAVDKTVTGVVDVDGNGALSPGDRVRYQVAYANNGNATAVGAELSDDPDETWVVGVTDVSDGGAYNGDTINWILGDLAPDETGFVTYEVSLGGPGTFPDGVTSVDNNATLSAVGRTPIQDSASVLVAADAFVSVSKTVAGFADLDGDGLVSPGDGLYYRIDYASTGNATATGVSVTDNPDETYVAGVSDISGGGSYDGDLVSWTLPDLAPSATGSLTYTVTLRGPGAFPHGQTQIRNLVAIRSNEDDDDDTHDQPVDAAADLSLDKAVAGFTDLDGDGLVSPGDEVDYALTYLNSGNAAATAVTLSDDPDEAYVVALVDISGGGTYDGDLITWNIGTVAAGASGTLTYTAVLAPAGTFGDGVTPVLNVAVLQSADLPDETDTAAVDVEAHPGVNIHKSVSATSPVEETFDNQALLESLEGGLVPSNVATATGVVVATRLSYQVAVDNAGNADAHSVRVTDTLPAGTAFVSASAGGVYDSLTGTVTWDLGTMATGASQTLDLVVETQH